MKVDGDNNNRIRILEVIIVLPDRTLLYKIPVKTRSTDSDSKNLIRNNKTIYLTEDPEGHVILTVHHKGRNPHIENGMSKETGKSVKKVVESTIKNVKMK